MGTTIRRQPINFDIPKSPDYKFLNITNFRGLDVSSNPFELATNTASDCLNVYVDETNTLTTRPRLEKKLSLGVFSELKHTVTMTKSLSTGYLIFTKQITGTYPVYYYQSSTSTIHNVTTNPSGTGWNVPAGRPLVFEFNSKVYVLDHEDSTNNERYWTVSLTETLAPEDSLVLEPIVGYVPLVSVIDEDNIAHEKESINLLSDKYKEMLPWEGDTPISIVNAVEISNDAYKKTVFEELSNYLILEYFDDNSFIARYNASLNANWAIYYGVFSDNFSSVSVKNTGITVPYNTEKCLAIAKNTKDLLIRNNSVTGADLYKFSDGGWTFSKTVYGIGPQTSQKLNLSPNSKFVWADGYDTKQPYVTSIDSGKKIALTTRSQYEEVYIRIGADETTIVELCKTTNAAGWYDWEVYLSKIENDTYTSGAYVTSFSNDHDKLGYVTDDGKYYYNYSDINSPDYPTYSGKKVFLIDLLNKSKRTLTYADKYLPNSFSINNDMISIVKNQDNTRYLYMAPLSDPMETFNTYVDLGKYSALYTVKPKRVIVVRTNNNTVPFVWQYEKAAITVTRQITEQSVYYSEWIDKRNKLLESRLMTRFDNNFWLASGNRYYRSANNDPSYFPIKEYNDLGDSNEEITGFNLANDTTLIAYKNNKVYLIQPYTSSLDTTEYSITEAKHTVGNTAFGASIVTTLTETPLQINNDGIYGLSQMTNVSATERIADLMSEPINERWLNIDDNIIKNAKTVNRLYWTYIILANEKQRKTMIYLLDNRYNTWFYWELPIVVVDAFVKDNRTEFADVVGNIYYLTTTDIIDINYNDEKITKYYDDGVKLIPWYWQSQILPMGTMNYSKRLVNTTFILTDTDDSDGYGLQYNFKVFRKLSSSTPEKEISDKLTLLRSTTKKTNISKFGFIQMRISNLTEESRDYEAFENNKLRLVGLGLKYVLLEGLIR
jgi:hypothetical protein